MPELRRFDLPGPPADAGYEHGRQLRDMLTPAFVRAYIDRVQMAVGFDPGGLHDRSLRWLAELPAHVQLEVDGISMGCGLPVADVAAFLFADIAGGSGPMCSSVITPLESEHPWVARNCDWLTPTLMRGTAAVCHATPNRIPIMALGIRGDIDVDTGINAEGLWLHLHTLHATDRVPEGQTALSWLFWAREALETCATIAELALFIGRVPRDRGVFVIACEGQSGDAAVFECGRAKHTRYDASESSPFCVTNHTLSKSYQLRPASQSNESGTIARYHAMEATLDTSLLRDGPDDLCLLLGSQGVEMRTPKWIRTIYSVVAEPVSNRIWFAAGLADGTPAASRGRWRRVTTPW